eukprot:gene22914-43311_t
MLEQRSMLLHRLSIEQRRMVKVVDVRDLTDVPLSQVVLRVSGFLKQLKSVIGAIQDYYPEIIHKVVVINAPSTFANIFAIISSVMNERMRSKVNIFGPGTAFTVVAAHFSAAGLRSWLTQRPHGEQAAQQPQKDILFGAQLTSRPQAQLTSRPQAQLTWGRRRAAR